MKFHAIAYCTVGTRKEIEHGMAGKRPELYQRMLADLKEYVTVCDQAGFEGFGHPEHHLQIEGMEATGSPGLLSMFIGQHSTRLKVDVLGYVLNTHNPLRVAEDVAMMDHMLEGRLNVAFVRGYQARWVQNYGSLPGVEAVGHWNKKQASDLKNRRAFEESVAVIKKAWSSDTFSHRGEFWQFPPEGAKNPHPMEAYTQFGTGVKDDMTIEEIGIAPRPYQQPHPPLYAGFTHNTESIRYWGREGGKPIIILLHEELCARLQTVYREEAEKAGRTVQPGTELALGGQLVLTENPSETSQIMADTRWFWEKWGIPFGLGVAEPLIGDPDSVSRKIELAQKIGTDEMFFLLGDGLLPRDTILRSFDLFATKVMPRFA